MTDKCGITEYCEMRIGDECTLGSPCPHQKPLTNEEWFNGLSITEKAKWLSRHSQYMYHCGEKQAMPKTMYEEDFVQWLKEKHNE